MIFEFELIENIIPLVTKILLFVFMTFTITNKDVENYYV